MGLCFGAAVPNHFCATEREMCTEVFQIKTTQMHLTSILNVISWSHVFASLSVLVLLSRFLLGVVGDSDTRTCVTYVRSTQ